MNHRTDTLDTTRTTRRVGRVKATVVALALGGSLAVTGGLAAQAAFGDSVNGTGVTSDSTGSTSSTSTGTSPGVSQGSGSSSHATTQGS